jgi:hypothetical protein
LARIILSHALLESIRFVMSRKECRDIYGLINTMHATTAWRTDVRLSSKSLMVGSTMSSRYRRASSISNLSALDADPVLLEYPASPKVEFPFHFTPNRPSRPEKSNCLMTGKYHINN